MAIHQSHAGAKAAVKELQHSGLDRKQLWIVGCDSHPEGHVIGYCNAGDRTTYWGTTGAFWVGS